MTQSFEIADRYGSRSKVRANLGSQLLKHKVALKLPMKYLFYTFMEKVLLSILSVCEIYVQSIFFKFFFYKWYKVLDRKMKTKET